MKHRIIDYADDGIINSIFCPTENIEAFIHVQFDAKGEPEFQNCSACTQDLEGELYADN